MINLTSCNDIPKSLLESNEDPITVNVFLYEAKNHSLLEETEIEEIELLLSSHESIQAMAAHFVTESSDKDELLASVTRIISAVNKVVPKVDINPDEKWKKFDLLRPHIISIIEEIDKLLEFYKIKASEELRLIQAELYNKIGESDYYNVHYPEAIANYRKALNILLDLRKNNPNLDIKKEYGDSCHGLGNTYMRQGEFDKALNNHKKALDFKLKISKNNPSDMIAKKNLATSYHGLGLLYQNQEKYDEALASYRKSLNIRLAIYKINPNHLGIKEDIAKNHNNLGVIYYNQRYYDKAIENYEKALEIKLDIYKNTPNHPSIARTYNNFGYVTIKKIKIAKLQGNYTEIKNNISLAKNYLTKADNMIKANHKKSLQLLARLLNSFGELYEVTGKFDKSIENYTKAFEIRTKITPDHPYTEKNKEAVERVKSYVEIQKIVSSATSDVKDQNVELQFNKEINLDHIKSYFENVLTAEIKDLETDREGNTTLKIHFDDRILKILDFLKERKSS